MDERKIVSLTKANNSESEEEKEKEKQLDSWTAEENQRSRTSGPVLGINWSHKAAPLLVHISKSHAFNCI